MKKLFILLLVCVFINTGIILPGQSKMSKPLNLNSKAKRQLKQIGKSIKSKNQLNPGLTKTFAQICRDIQSRGVPVDINALVQFILRDSYMEEKKDLEFYVSKVKFFNSLKKDIRKYTQELKVHLNKANLKSNLKPHYILIQQKDFSSAFKFSRNSVKAAKSSKSQKSKLLSPRINFYLKKVKVTPRQLANELNRMNDVLNSVGDDAQRANIELQKALQNHQQAMQMLQQASKMLKNAGNAALRKIG